MSRPNPALLLGYLVGIVAVFAGLQLAKGGVYVSIHEGDTLHLVDILSRMALGQRIHLDFVTPVGIAAFAPGALLLSLGLGVGHAFILSQVLVAVLLLPAVWWVAISRCPRRLSLPYGLAVLALLLALIYGGPDREVSMSLHYNRWAWAVSFIVLPVALLPSRGRDRPIVDGLVVGLGMAALLLCKATFFVALALPVAVVLYLRRARRALGIALATGIAVVGLVTLAFGIDFWTGYVSDLRLVRDSSLRPKPADELVAVVAAPAFLGGSLILLAVIVLLRHAKDWALRTGMILLVPGFLYLTYQNSENDPKWLFLVSIVLLAALPKPGITGPFGADLRQGFVLTAFVSFALIAPSFISLVLSSLWNLSADPARHRSLVPNARGGPDVFLPVQRAERLTGVSALAGAIAPDAAQAPPLIFRDETLPSCSLYSGLPGWVDAIVADMEAAGLARGRSLFVADRYSPHWLFGAVAPLRGGAPWYYGALSGFENADLVLVPLCAADETARWNVLADIDARGTPLDEIRRNPLYILFEKAGE